MISEIIRAIKIGWPEHASGPALDSGMSNFGISCKTYHIQQSEQSLGWLMRNSPDKI